MSLPEGVSPPQLRLVLAPSSAGKTTFIERMIRQDPTLSSADVVMGFRVEELLESGGPRGRRPVILHLNMLHFFDNNLSQTDGPVDPRCVLRRLRTAFGTFAADVLVCSGKELRTRALLRDLIEPEYLAPVAQYPSLHFFDIYSTIDLKDIYARWIDQLAEAGVPFRLLSSTDERYQVMSDFAEASALIDRDDPVRLDAAGTARALSRIRSSYQRMDDIAPELAHGSEAGDRRATFAAIRPHLAGTSLLDIGCGQGYFCFKAKEIGFETVVGTDLKPDRLTVARVLNHVRDAGIEFRDENVFANPASMQFDTVLLLNVLHHLHEPFHALRWCSDAARETLVLEFVTPSDRKFQASFSGGPVDPAAPFIGVSDFAEQDQTYVFTEEALRRVLVANGRLFGSVEFLVSPMSPHRRIAICRK